METTIIFDFKKNQKADDQWTIVDDVVMGGRSNGNFSLDEEGHGVFEGLVSLENNGGFSSVRHRFETLNVGGYSKIRIRLKGDGKTYQFRAKHDRSEYFTYRTEFNTSGEWETIDLAWKDMIPVFRGRVLDQPNFEHDRLEEIGFLIANKQNETFQLVLDKIELVP